MDIEQLKLILAALEGASDAAVNVFLVFMAVEVLEMLFVLAGVVAVLWCSYRLLSPLVQTSRHEIYLREIRNTLYPNTYGYYSESEHRQVMAKIRERE